MIILGPSLLASYAAALPPLAASAIISGVSVLVLPFLVIAQTLLYYDLKARPKTSPAAYTHDEEITP